MYVCKCFRERPHPSMLMPFRALAHKSCILSGLDLLHCVQHFTHTYFVVVLAHTRTHPRIMHVKHIVVQHLNTSAGSVLCAFNMDKTLTTRCPHCVRSVLTVKGVYILWNLMMGRESINTLILTMKEKDQKV